MKKLCYWLLAAVMVISMLSGCKKEAEASLTVYVVETEALYTKAIGGFIEDHPAIGVKVETFDTYDAMNEKLSTELMSGEGPDVLLFNSLYSTQDPYKLSSGSTLLNLDEKVSELTEEDYYKPILDAGVMNGHQYFIPISWNVLQAYTMDGETADLYTAIPAEAEALSQEEDKAISSTQFMREDLLNFFMENMGTKLIDTENGTLIEDKEALRKTAEFVKIIYDNLDRIKNITTTYSNDFAGAVSHLTYLVENYPFMNNLRFYQSVYPSYMGDEMKIGSFGQTAQVIQYGAINGNTDDADAAWELLLYLTEAPASMDFSKYQSHTIYYAPVSRVEYENCVDELMGQRGMGPVKIEPLTEENGQVLLEMAEKAVGVIPNGTLGALIQECMEPYLLGEAEFDTCYETLMQRAELYLDE